MLLLFMAAIYSWSQPPAIPDTPAGHTLQAWFDAFNSGDRARIQDYLTKYDPTRPLEPTLGFRAQTGGFELLGIDKSDRLHIEFRVKEKAGPTNAVGKLEVKDGDPAQVVSFGVRAIPPGMTAADMNPKIGRSPKMMRRTLISTAVPFCLIVISFYEVRTIFMPRRVPSWGLTSRSFPGLDRLCPSLLLPPQSGVRRHSSNLPFMA